MTSRRQVLGRSSALAALLVALACQRESSADFDDSHLPSGAGAVTSGGTKPSAGDGAGAKPATGGAGATGDGGSAADGGDSDTGGSSTAGTNGNAGSASGGGGKGGASAGSSAGGATAGSGGKPPEPDPEPEPVTVTITDIADAHVVSCATFMNYGNAEKLTVGGNFICSYSALIEPELDKIPNGAEIVSASLELTCTNAGGALSVAYVNGAWSEDSVRWMDRPGVGSTLASVTCAEAGPVKIDLAVAVRAWLTGERQAYGVYLESLAEDATDFVSADGDDADDRPALVVTYKPKK